MVSQALEFEGTTERKAVLIIAGSDSFGMAGIQQDIRCCNALDVHPATVVTANTAQNNDAVFSISPVGDSALNDQLFSVQALKAEVIKLGLLCTMKQVAIVSEFKGVDNAKLIYDPVLAATNGTSLVSESILNDIKERIIPLCYLVTPNLHEAEQLAGFIIKSKEDLVRAARAILALGARAVLIKGGHIDGPFARDYFNDGSRSVFIANERINTKHSRGTGCALSSCVSAALARGYDLYDALVIGKMAVQQGLRNAKSVNACFGNVCVRNFPKSFADLPVITAFNDDKDLRSSIIENIYHDVNKKFKSCGETPLGLYPVVNTAEWVERLLTLGVSTIQLRVKNISEDCLRTEIKQAVKITERFPGSRLFINDHWQLAIEYQAYGVHLGQEDLDEADLCAIHHAGLRLGISTHSFFEVARAHAIQPSYIAVGPVFATISKDMPWIPRGISGLEYWQALLSEHYPLVAIGGINYERAKKIAELNVSGVAMISAITHAPDPDKATLELLALFN